MNIDFNFDENDEQDFDEESDEDFENQSDNSLEDSGSKPKDLDLNEQPVNSLQQFEILQNSNQD